MSGPSYDARNVGSVAELVVLATRRKSLLIDLGLLVKIGMGRDAAIDNRDADAVPVDPELSRCNIGVDGGVRSIDVSRQLAIRTDVDDFGIFRQLLEPEPPASVTLR